MTESLFYRLTAGQTEKVSEEQFIQDGAGICYLSLEKLRGFHDRLGIAGSTLNEISAGNDRFRSSLDVYGDMSVGCINIINVEDLAAEMDSVGFILKKDLLCLVRIRDEDGSELATIQSILAQDRVNTSIPKIFCSFLERLLKGGNQMLETTEGRLLELEDEVAHGRGDAGLNKVIYQYRKQLSAVRNYYEQFVDITSEMEENENSLFEEKDAAYFRVLTAKAERLVLGVRSLSENLMHLREMLDAALNYSLNSIMKFFTMITAIFLPLTLLVGWYGMNFQHMPELDWIFGYPMVIALSVAIVLLILYLFRRKKLL